MRRQLLGVLLLPLLGMIAWRAWPGLPPAPATQYRGSAREVRESRADPSPQQPVPVAATPAPVDEERSELADGLNAPDGDITRDLGILQEVFAAWRTNFTREGNPVGENAEITRALAGDNALRLVLVPSGHPAIGKSGELRDRWGTPFRFHQISGDRMEIRSAGPDRRFATGDDAVLTP